MSRLAKDLELQAVFEILSSLIVRCYVEASRGRWSFDRVLAKAGHPLVPATRLSPTLCCIEACTKSLGSCYSLVLALASSLP